MPGSPIALIKHMLGSSVMCLFILAWDQFYIREGCTKIIPSQMEVAPLHCTVDITQKRRLFKNTKEIEKM